MIAPVEIPAPGGPYKSSARRARIDAIIIHDTASHSAASAFAWWSRPEVAASAHVVIDRDGTIYRCVPDARAAWHAGVADLWGWGNVNARSLGCELVDYDPGSGAGDAYPAAQLGAAVALVAWWADAYGVPLHRIVGHEHVARPLGRRRDPGPDFPWSAFLLAVAARQLACP